MSRSSVSGIFASPWSRPWSVPPSARKCLVEEMTCGRRRKSGAARFALQALHEDAGIRRHDARVFRIAFVGAAPAIVLRHRDGGREGPVDAGGAHLFGGDARDFA